MEECGENRSNSPGEKSEVCRLCFGTADVTVPIAQHEDNKTSIVEQIHYCTSLVVKVGDSFNQNICKACVTNLDSMYNFKSKAIACDLELSKNVRKDEQFTYVQVSDDPLNMTYNLDLEEQDWASDLVDSYVYNIIDADELTIEPVNNVDKSTVSNVNEFEYSVTESTNLDSTKTLTVTINNENENSIKYQYYKSASPKKMIDYVKRSSTNSSLKEDKRKQKKLKVENDIDDEKPLLIVKNGKVMYICGECDFESDSMSFILNHRARAHLDYMGHYKCAKCPNSYKTPGLLKRHTSMHHDTHFCEHCDKKFSNKHSLERHINIYHKVTQLEFQCVKCNAEFDTMDKMEDHLVIHYMDPSSIFICDHCDRTFTTFAAKNKHIEHEHMIEIECNICHVVLPSKEAMDKHNNSVHQPKKTGNKTYACTTCEKCFTDIKDILNHRKTHIKNDMI